MTFVLFFDLFDMDRYCSTTQMGTHIAHSTASNQPSHTHTDWTTNCVRMLSSWVATVAESLTVGGQIEIVPSDNLTMETKNPPC